MAAGNGNVGDLEFPSFQLVPACVCVFVKAAREELKKMFLTEEELWKLVGKYINERPMFDKNFLEGYIFYFSICNFSRYILLELSQSWV